MNHFVLLYSSSFFVKASKDWKIANNPKQVETMLPKIEPIVVANSKLFRLPATVPIPLIKPKTIPILPFTMLLYALYDI